MGDVISYSGPASIPKIPLTLFTSPRVSGDLETRRGANEPASDSVDQATRRHIGVIFNVLTDAIIIYDAVGRVVHMNQANLELFGIDPAAQDYYQRSAERRMAALRIRDTSGVPMPADQWPLTRTLRGETLRGDSAVDILVHTLDGKEKVVSVTGAPLHDTAGAITGAICIFRDVTSRRQLTTELAARVAQLQAVLQALADPMIVYDKDGRIVEMNHYAEELTGYTLSSEAYAQARRDNKPLVPLFDAGGRALRPHERPVSRVLRGELFSGPSAQELWLEKPNGERAAISVTGAPMRDETGAIVGAVNIVRDVTERRRLERQKEEFLSIASHELRTPLTSIKVLAQFVASELRAAGIPDLEKSARIMERSIARMERLVNDLLDVSRIDAGKLTLRSARCDLVDLCRHVIDEASRATGRAITFESPHGELFCRADEDRIGQAISNLLSNAIKYSMAEHPVTLSLSTRDGEALLGVRDYGVGIPSETLPQLFQRFYRAPGIEVQFGSGVGLGLGLYITRELVERHGGRIWVESASGVGSVFWLALPIEPSASSLPQADDQEMWESLTEPPYMPTAAIVDNLATPELR